MNKILKRWKLSKEEIKYLRTPKRILNMNMKIEGSIAIKIYLSDCEKEKVNPTVDGQIGAVLSWGYNRINWVPE